MKKETKRSIVVAVALLAAFVLWTVAISIFDVEAIGPNGSEVGFATLNGFVHNLTGENMTLYIITDWLGLVPFAIVFAFGVAGLAQWIRRKSFLRVDYSILVLGGFYVIVMAVYIFFEFFVVNYRPVLINGILEVSYPSSTTMLVMCVMPTTIMQMNSRIKNVPVRRCTSVVISLFIAFMVIGRLISGVHWVTDIIGGAILSAGLVTVYSAFCSIRD